MRIQHSQGSPAGSAAVARARLTEAALADWGRRLGRQAEPPLFIALAGPLGAGKSALARAVARGAGVQGPVPSPTFNLLFRYGATRGREIVHLDLYRLAGPEELHELGWDELGAGHEIVLVEWPEKAGPRLPADRWEIRLALVSGAPELRDVQIEAVGSPGPLAPLPADSAPAGRERG